MVTPYFTQHRPPALVAALPPIEHISNDDGSGGYQSPCSAAAFFTSTLSSARLGDRHPRDGVDADRAHPLGGEHDAVLDGRRAAGQPGAGAARHHRHAVFGGPAQRRLHVGGAGGPHDGERPAGVGVAGPVLPVAGDDVAVVDDDRRSSGRARRAGLRSCRHDLDSSPDSAGTGSALSRNSMAACRTLDGCGVRRRRRDLPHAAERSRAAATTPPSGSVRAPRRRWSGPTARGRRPCCG